MTLPVYWPGNHSAHHPGKDYSDGLPPFDHLEVPQRIDEILSGIRRAARTDEVRVDEQALDEVYGLHDRDYVDFLLDIEGQLGPDCEYIPPVFRGELSASPLYFRGGMYCSEVGTPIGCRSIGAALNSAATAVAAANGLVTSGTDVFAICRPPGHHAGRRRYGGYCFFNNAYLAAHAINRRSGCVVLDIDYHLGDGSIEFANGKAPYYSLHADPWRNYPYLDSGRDINLPDTSLHVFPGGIDGSRYNEHLKEVLAEVESVSPDYVILSLGFDTLESDYIQDEYIHLQPQDYGMVGESIGELKTGFLIMLEGGYDLARLADCSAAFTEGFLSVR